MHTPHALNTSNWYGTTYGLRDNRLRELASLLRCLLVPKDSPYARALTAEDEDWKKMQAAYKGRRREGGSSESLGSKHLKLGKVLLSTYYKDPAIPEPLKKLLMERWDGQDRTGTEFLAPDIKLVKWRLARDGKHGVLEFKLTDSLAQVEEGLVRVLTNQGARLNSGPDSRGTRVRKLEEDLQGTW